MCDTFEGGNNKNESNLILDSQACSWEEDAAADYEEVRQSEWNDMRNVWSCLV